jgi:hypothetical protein
VSTAYGMGSKEDPLTFLLTLDGEVADREVEGSPIEGSSPGVAKKRTSGMLVSPYSEWA